MWVRMGTAVLSYFALTVVPNCLLRNATDLQPIESIPGIAVVTQPVNPTMISIFALGSIAYLLAACIFCLAEMNPAERKRGTQQGET